MKKTVKLLGIILLAAVIGFSFAACDDDSSEADTSLNGTWVYTEGNQSSEWKFDNGSLEMSGNGIPLGKGTYTTGGGTITIQQTHFYGLALGLDPKWYSRNELESYIKANTTATDEEIAEELDDRFIHITAGYSINGSTLTLTNEGNTMTLTRK